MPLFRALVRVLARALRLGSIAVLGVATVVLALGLGRALGEERRAASPGPQATSGPGLATHENQVLGYRISLPVTYRRSGSRIFAGNPELLGRDTYTFRSEAEERADCLVDAGDVPLPSAGALVDVTVYAAGTASSAAEWANGSAFKSPRASVQQTTTNGNDAARIVEDGATSAYVVRANDRMYVLAPSLWPSQHRLDDIVASFQAIPPQPFPTATPRVRAPRDAAAEQARVLAAAFAARDAAAIERSLPACRFGVSAVVEPVQRGSEVCCILNRSVPAFMSALRGHFASSDLFVTVDPSINVLVDGQGSGRAELYFVRSSWAAFGRVTPIDLFLTELDGAWYWTNARHHYQRSELAKSGTCVEYRSPWVPVSASC